MMYLKKWTSGKEDDVSVEVYSREGDRYLCRSEQLGRRIMSL
jgi:hypothetical protein